MQSYFGLDLEGASIVQVRVYYEDTDAGGIVYHSNYLNFCERARSEAFFAKGLKPFMSDAHFVAKRIEAEYIASAKLGDLLHIKTSLVEFRAASFTLLQEVYKDEQKLFELKIVLVFTNYEAKVKKIDTKTKELIESLFSKTL